MFLFTKGKNEQSVPFKITVSEQFMNIWKKNNQVYLIARGKFREKERFVVSIVK